MARSVIDKFSNNIFTSSATAPSSPAAADVWYDTANSVYKHYTGSEWLQMSNKFTATGGTISTYTSGGQSYKVHTFTSSGTFIPSGAGSVDVLIVGGGGGGGTCNVNSEQGGGGGGAGGFITSSGTSGGNTSAISQITVQAQTYTVTVGAGGAGAGNVDDTAGTQGGNSSFAGITAFGGGGGGGNSAQGTTGGSGGGGQESGGSGKAGTSGQGFAGGNGSEADDRGGGGGGASQTGRNYNSTARSDG